MQIPACTRVCMRFCTRVCRPFAHGVRRSGVCIRKQIGLGFKHDLCQHLIIQILHTLNALMNLIGQLASIIDIHRPIQRDVILFRKPGDQTLLMVFLIRLFKNPVIYGSHLLAAVICHASLILIRQKCIYLLPPRCIAAFFKYFSTKNKSAPTYGSYFPSFFSKYLFFMPFNSLGSHVPVL